MTKIIDLRSDTVTKPTPGMLEAMMHAEVGDDVWNEDPTVHELERKAARLFGMQAGLFCPSGTMTNQIAIRLMTKPQDEVVCDQRAHIYNYEGGGIAYNSFCSVRLLDGDRGRLSAKMVEENILADDIHYPRTSLIALENTVNKGGGSIYTVDRIGTISQVCRRHKLGLHLDGARVFNALVETGEDPVEYGRYFDTISVCLSKGLGAPVGSVLLLPADKVQEAKRIRKVFGGGMRQAGFLAAAGIYALDHHVKRLREDHKRARELGQTLEKLPFVEHVLPVDTNIVIFRLAADLEPAPLLQKMKQKGLMAAPFGKKEIRFVTHLDYTGEMHQQVIRILKELNP
ncbi:low specificity L-threonine aldolase [Roseivirga sp. BDSF3-8]|uniref:threonine aldolase family protein n=1 Tax=Roseivirga sp. BDSF3-8 TaxID=3241598 RepID=UPI0035319581